MNIRAKRTVGVAIRLAFVAAVVSITVLKYDFLTNIDVRNLICGIDSIFGAMSIIWGVYALKSIVFVVPASMLYMSVGMAFDFLPGFLINTIGIILELNITFFIGRFLGGDTVERKLLNTKYGEKIITLRDEKPARIFIVRLLPVFPIDFVSLFLGASGMKYPYYMAVSFLGIIPRVLVITLLGDKIYDLLPRKWMMTLVIVIIIAALAVSTVKYIVKNKGKLSDERK